MPSAVQKRSLGSVTVFSLDREIIEKAIERFVDELSNSCRRFSLHTEELKDKNISIT